MYLLINLYSVWRSFDVVGGRKARTVQVEAVGRNGVLRFFATFKHLDATKLKERLYKTDGSLDDNVSGRSD